MRNTLLLTLALTATALAANEFVQRVEYDAATGVYRSGIAVADSTTITNITPTATVISIKTYLKIAVSARMSTSNATCKITLIRGHQYNGIFTPLSVSHQTATANATFKDPDGLYFADDLVFDTEGYTHAIIAVEAPSAGTVTLVPTRY